MKDIGSEASSLENRYGMLALCIWLVCGYSYLIQGQQLLYFAIMDNLTTEPAAWVKLQLLG